MDSQPLCRLFFRIMWIFVFFVQLSQQDVPKLSLESRVFVAFSGEDLTIDCHVRQPANQSEDTLTCFNPAHKQIYSCPIPSTAGRPKSQNIKLSLSHVNISGEYYCKYQKAAVYWFVHVRDGGFKMPEVQDSIELILVGAVTAVLLVFSVVGSFYVFRGCWNSKCRQADKTRKENKECMKKRREKNENVAAVPESSTSFYASLEPRTRSIYDELHRSPTNGSGQQRVKPKKKEPHQTKQQTRPEEGQFDSVYENY